MNFLEDLEVIQEAKAISKRIKIESSFCKSVGHSEVVRLHELLNIIEQNFLGKDV